MRAGGGSAPSWEMKMRFGADARRACDAVDVSVVGGGGAGGGRGGWGLWHTEACPCAVLGCSGK